MDIGDVNTQALAAALRGLDAQRQAHEANLSNIETPGYKARVVSFEDSLGRAIRSGDPSRAAITTTKSTAATRIDGNNVKIDGEVLDLQRNALQQQLVTEALNGHFRRIRAALGR